MKYNNNNSRNGNNYNEKGDGEREQDQELEKGIKPKKNKSCTIQLIAHCPLIHSIDQ